MKSPRYKLDEFSLMKRIWLRHSKALECLVFLIIFNIGYYGFTYIRFVGLAPDLKQSLLNEFAYNPIMPFLTSLLLYLLNKQITKISPLIQDNLGKAFQYLLIFNLSLVSALLSTHAITSLLFLSFSWQVLYTTWRFSNSPLLIGLLLYSNVIFLLYTIFKFIIKIVGLGTLFRLFTYSHSQPVQEPRVFMFIDLNNSTQTSIQLGPLDYSNFLKACFIELSFLQVKYQAEHYQYVGDEAVISWVIDPNFDPEVPFRLFFEFSAVLQAKKNEFLNTYGVIPEFKAALNSGNVTSTTLGVSRKELAYHGRVLSEAARILSLCNPLQKKLLVGESYAGLLRPSQTIYLSRVKETVLKGFTHKITIYEPILH